MSAALIFRNAAGDLLQVNDYAVGARVDDGNGGWVSVFYNRATEKWEIETDSAKTRAAIQEQVK